MQPSEWDGYKEHVVTDIVRKRIYNSCFPQYAQKQPCRRIVGLRSENDFRHVIHLNNIAMDPEICWTKTFYDFGIDNHPIWVQNSEIGLLANAQVQNVQQIT